MDADKRGFMGISLVVLPQIFKLNFSQRRKGAKKRKNRNIYYFFLCAFAPLRETILVAAVTAISLSGFLCIHLWFHS